KLVARSACRIGGTHFFLSGNGKLGAYFIQYMGKRFCDALRSLVVSAGTTYPEKYLGHFTIRSVFRHCFNHSFKNLRYSLAFLMLPNILPISSYPVVIGFLLFVNSPSICLCHPD